MPQKFRNIATRTVLVLEKVPRSKLSEAPIFFFTEQKSDALICQQFKGRKLLRLISQIWLGSWSVDLIEIGGLWSVCRLIWRQTVKMKYWRPHGPSPSFHYPDFNDDPLSTYFKSRFQDNPTERQAFKPDVEKRSVHIIILL